MSTSREPDDRGAVVVLVAVGMLALMGVMALAIDGGNLYRARGHLQNAADHVAMAAAYADCTGGDPVAVGLAQADANGFPHDGDATVVSISEDGAFWRASVSHTFGGFFSTLVGAERLTTWGEAVANCQPGAGEGYAVFAGASNCGIETLDWSGSDTTIEGDVHSNDGVKVGGSDNDVDGSATKRNSIGDDGGIDWTVTGQAQAWPVDFTIEDFLPGGPVHQAIGSDYNHVPGDLDLKERAVDGVIPDGVYVSEGVLVVSDSDLSGRVTLVAAPSPDNRDKGTIEFSGSGQNFRPYWQGLLAFSNGRKHDSPTSTDNCDFAAIKMSGSDNHWEGILFAPRGQIEFSGSNTSALDGSLIAYSVKLNGSGMNIKYSGASGGGEPRVSLRQ